VSCVAFCMATTITAQFWLLHWVTGGLVERSSDRPPWLGFMVHVFNSIMAWADIVVSRPRTFSLRAWIMTGIVAAGYGAFIASCRCARQPPPPASHLGIFFVQITS
jgi:hypothetical protein